MRCRERQLEDDDGVALYSVYMYITAPSLRSLHIRRRLGTRRFRRPDGWLVCYCSDLTACSSYCTTRIAGMESVFQYEGQISLEFRNMLLCMQHPYDWLIDGFRTGPSLFIFSHFMRQCSIYCINKEHGHDRPSKQLPVGPGKSVLMAGRQAPTTSHRRVCTFIVQI